MSDTVSPMLEHALAYHRLGFSVVPAHPTTKKPATMWKGKQNERMAEDDLRKWFANPENSPYRIGLVCGKVSGNLAVRDFDSMTAYNSWASGYPEFAATLPTVATGRPGRHVYLRSTGSLKTRDFGDGEFRGDGAFIMAPPSRHGTGVAYQWIGGIPNEIPDIDPETAGLLQRGDPPTDGGIVTENTESTERTEDMSSILSVTSAVERAIRDTLPSGVGDRHSAVFRLARRLKAIPELADSPAKELRDVFAAWYRAVACPMDVSESEAFWDFKEGWDKVRWAAGVDPVRVALELAMKDDTPECAKHYDNPKMMLLVALCRRLQESAGKSPFFLACRTAGDQLGIPYRAAARWLRGLVFDGVLVVTDKHKGGADRRAHRYRYIGDQ